LIPADTTWRNYIRYYTDSPGRVNHVETRISEAEQEIRSEYLDDLSVVSSSFTAEPESGVKFATEVDLQGATPDRVTILALFFDDSGVFRGTIRGIENHPSDTVAISGQRIGLRTPPNLDTEQITDFVVLVFEGVV
jgi:hypothetical protein